MPEFNAPQQLFDGSLFEAFLETPQLEIAPPEVEIETVEEDDPALGEIETFDWDAYNRAFFERIPDSAKHGDEGRRIAQIAGTQIWMAKRLPSEVVGYLLQAAPSKLLWTYLQAKERKELLHTATRGFQRTPQIVRHAAVRARLLQHWKQNASEIYILLVMWSFGEPPVLSAIPADSSDRELKTKLPSLIFQYGIEATVAGVAFAARPRVFGAISLLLQDSEALERLVQKVKDENAEAAERAAERAASEIEAPLEPQAPLPDSSAAHFWKEQFDSSDQNRRQLSSDLENLLDLHEKAVARLSRQKTELETIEKREKIALSLAQKKLEHLQKRAHDELEELKKNFERQNRKFRALEREKIELDLENRRFKKQLRRAGTLLEEERKKIAGLEAKTRVASAPVEAISTPSSKQSAPDKPVVVQAPTPLDEIFEWRADKRPVRVTPRAVRRLIDKNDEEGVFSIVQALESLQLSDPHLHGKFLKRLSDGAPYYGRVLKENMARVLVDASNVARHTPNKYGKGQLRFLLGMREELRRLGCFPIIFIADASLRHVIDESRKFHEMIDSGEIEVVDKGVEADEILAREARRTGAYVVTNDAKFFHKVSPDFEPPRVTFRIYDGLVIVDEF